MSNLEFFEDTAIKLIDNEVYASRAQIQKLYGSNKSTISRVISELKEDDLLGADNQIVPINGNNLNNRRLEIFNLDSIIAIGMRLRSDRAISFQKWAIKKLKEEILSVGLKIAEAKEETRKAQIMESIAWNHLDAHDNYK